MKPLLSLSIFLLLVIPLEAVSAAEMTVGFVHPQPSETTGPDLDVVVAVDAGATIKMVIAEIDTLSFVLSRSESAYLCGQPVTHFPNIRCPEARRLPGWIGTFSLDSLAPGDKTLIVTVIDAEGNTTQSELDFRYRPIKSP